MTFLGTALVIVAITFVGTALIVLSACVLAGRADAVIERGRDDV
jgi:hypothetical protein